jgi:hypothetical protein
MTHALAETIPVFLAVLEAAVQVSIYQWGRNPCQGTIKRNAHLTLPEVVRLETVRNSSGLTGFLPNSESRFAVRSMRLRSSF